METILILGGAGYIGSHANKILSNRGYSTIVYDNLSTGHKESVKWGKFILGDILDKEMLSKVFSENKIDAVMHFAASTDVGESVTDPGKYYKNNVATTINLLETMREFNISYFIFSSTCATYGTPNIIPIPESHKQNPINSYGRTKLIVEQMLKDYSDAYDLKYAALRYFNAAGADPETEIGEWHEPETHLIPLILEVALGKRDFITIYGDDYDTKDGTCIRDYIHIFDIVDAHIKALEYLIKNDKSVIVNLGNGNGYSVLDIINASKKITNLDIPTKIGERREGDAISLIGDATKARTILNWKPQYQDINVIIETAWKWHQKLTTTIKK